MSILARSASEGRAVPRLRFGLRSQECSSCFFADAKYMSQPHRRTPDADITPLRVFAPRETATAPEAARHVLNDPDTGGVRQLIAHADAFREVVERASRIACSKVPVLIQG